MHFLNLFIVLTYVWYTYICMFLACCFRQRTCVAQGLFNGVFNETWTQSCFQYKWPLLGQTGLYRGHCSSFLESVYFGLLYPPLIFDMFIVCVCVCVCVCVLALEWFRISLTAFFVCVSVYHGKFCGFKFTGSSFSLFLYIWVFFFRLRTYLA